MWCRAVPVCVTNCGTNRERTFGRGFPGAYRCGSINCWRAPSHPGGLVTPPPRPLIIEFPVRFRVGPWSCASRRMKTDPELGELHQAIKHGDLLAVRHYLDRGGDVRSTDRNG